MPTRPRASQPPPRRPTHDAPASASPALFPAAAWAQSTSLLWRSFEVSERMQAQWMSRMALRSQEMVTHWRVPSSPSDWLDMPLASMRWALQEWEQASQDAITAVLDLRGGNPQDDASGPAEPPPSLDDAVDPVLNNWNEWATEQMRVWMQLWMAAGQQRHR